jgi:NAD(P)-dependent dehydrogenase (short-subunit alcohol dehydrogenase family)
MQMTASLQGSILVTGASGGLGTALASHITTHYPAYYGIYTVRDASAPNHTLTSILTSSHEIVSLDLSRHASVRAAAADINARVARGQIPPIRVLILNAGLLEFEQQTWTEDGFDMSFAVNYLGHFLLTLLLLHSMDREQGRVVWIGSSTHDPYAPVVGRHYPNNRWKTIIPGQSTDAIAKGTWSTRAEDPTLHSGFRRYGAAKLCVAMMVYVFLTDNTFYFSSSRTV